MVTVVTVVNLTCILIASNCYVFVATNEQVFFGLKINAERTKLLRLNISNTEKVQVDGQDMEEMESFVYLSANVSNEGGTEDNTKARLGKARLAYNKLDKFWKNSQFTIRTKVNVFKSSVISVLLYGCETWRTTKADEKKLDAFLHQSLRRILKIYWPMRIANEEVRRRAGIRETISDPLARQRWTWLGHVLRMWVFGGLYLPDRDRNERRLSQFEYEKNVEIAS